MATDEESARKPSGLARGSDPAKSHKDAPGRHRFGADNQPPKAKVGRPRSKSSDGRSTSSYSKRDGPQSAMSGELGHRHVEASVHSVLPT
jgi:hypothetical protein